MTMRRPEVSVIIPHYDDLTGLGLCLDSLCSQSASMEDTVEIVVADNNSPCGREAVEDLVRGRARVVVALEKGAGPARNAGIAAARGSLLAFTDSDCIPEPGWLSAGLATLERFDLVGGRMEVLVGAEDAMTGPEAFERVFAFDNRDYVERKGFTVTANLFCRAETAAAVGPFGTGVSEDREWCLRAVRKGMTIGYAPDAVVGHPARATWRDLLGKWRRIDRESYALWRSEGKSVVGWLGRSWLLPASIVPHAVKVMRSDRVVGPRDRIKALSTLVAHRMWRFWDQQRLLLR